MGNACNCVSKEDPKGEIPLTKDKKTNDKKKVEVKDQDESNVGDEDGDERPNQDGPEYEKAALLMQVLFGYPVQLPRQAGEEPSRDDEEREGEGRRYRGQKGANPGPGPGGESTGPQKRGRRGEIGQGEGRREEARPGRDAREEAEGGLA